MITVCNFELVLDSLKGVSYKPVGLGANRTLTDLKWPEVWKCLHHILLIILQLKTDEPA